MSNPNNRLPTDIPPNPDERFDALLRAMLAGQASGTKHKEHRTSDAAHDADCSDTQTPKDTSEDVS